MFGWFKRENVRYGIPEMVRMHQSMSQAYMLALKAIEDSDNQILVEQHLKQADELMEAAVRTLENYLEDLSDT